MAGSLPTYDASSVGTPWQELVKAIPTLTTGFSTVYTSVSSPGVDNVVQQPAQPAQPAPITSGINGTTLAYAGLGLAAIVGAVLVIKAVT